MKFKKNYWHENWGLIRMAVIWFGLKIMQTYNIFIENVLLKILVWKLF